MASPAFLSGSPAIPGLPSPGASALDGTPPTPTPMGGLPPGAPFSLRGLAPGGSPGASVPGSIPSTELSPEILTGLQQAMKTATDVLKQAAQITPDKGAQLGLINDLIEQYMADVMMAGSGPVSPNYAGPAFPGGGIDRGLPGPGTVGA